MAFESHLCSCCTFRSFQGSVHHLCPPKAKTRVESNVGRIEYKNARGKKESVLSVVKPLIRSAVMMPKEAEAVHGAHVVPVLYNSTCQAVDSYGRV